MPLKWNVLSTALVCATAAGLLTGCDGGKSGADDKPTDESAAPPTSAAPKGPLDNLTAQRISDLAVATMRQLNSVAVTGTGTDSGKAFQIKIASSTAGDCVATIGTDGGTMRIIGNSHYTYMKGDSTFWKSQGKDGAAIGTALHGRWLRSTGSASKDADMKSVCDLLVFMADFTKDDGGAKTKGAPTMIGHQTVIPVSEKMDDGSTTTVYIADAVRPYVLRGVSTGGSKDSDETLSFSAFNQPVHAVAPPAAQTVSRTTLRM